MPLEIKINGKLASLWEVMVGLKRGPKKNDLTIDWPITSIKVCAIEPAQVTALAEALKESSAINSTLVTLDLSGCRIGAAGAAAIATVLETSSALTTLDLTKNNIRSVGATAIATALEGNNALTTLGLANNNIGNEGAVALATALERNDRLTTLGLADNNIGDEGATALTVAALERNVSITGLNIGWSHFDVTNNLNRVLSLSKNIVAKLSDSLKSSRKLFTLTDQEREYIATPVGVLRVLSNFLKQNPDVVLDEDFQKRIVATSPESSDGKRLLANAIAAMVDDRVFPTLKTLPESRGLKATLDNFARIVGGGDEKIMLPLPDFVQEEILKFLGTDAIKIAESTDAGAVVESTGSGSRGGGGGGSGGSSSRTPRRTAGAPSGAAVAPPPPPRFPWR